MSGLSSLKFVTTQRQQLNNPAVSRRQKLSAKIHEQIQIAKAQQMDTEYRAVKTRKVMDPVTGEVRHVEVPKRIKPWWWRSETGKLCITVRYGARTLEVVEGKNAIEADDLAGVIITLEVLRSAVDAGELDARIEAVSGLVKAGLGKNEKIEKRSKIKPPTKSN